jgi:hypothetical protein
LSKGLDKCLRNLAPATIVETKNLSDDARQVVYRNAVLLAAPLAGETSSQHCPGLTLAWSLALSLVGRLEVTPACAPAGAPACARAKGRTRPTFSQSSPYGGCFWVELGGCYLGVGAELPAVVDTSYPKRVPCLTSRFLIKH